MPNEIEIHEPVRDGYGSRCRDPYSGVWIPTADCAWHVEELSSKYTFALGPNGVTRYEFEYRIVNATALIPSHDPFTFEPNSKFPQVLQPRLRGRAANRVQVETMAANLDPDSLLTDFRSLDRGAPIVGPDMAVESGNGRVMAIIRSASEHPAIYERYRLALYEIAVAYDLSVGAAERLPVPVLVRVRLTDTDRVAFVQEANAPATLSASSIETARTDAARVTLPMLMSLVVGDTESLEDALRATRNVQFVTQFLSKLAPNEQARLVDATGKLNQDGVRRAVAAVFVRAFPGDAGLALAERVFETLDNDIRNVIGGIGRSLGPLAQLGALIADGKRPAELDIAGDLAATVPVFTRIKRTPGQTVADYLNQAQLFGRELTPFQETVLRFLDENSRSGKRISQVLRGYADAVIALPPPEQVSFMPVEAPDKAALWSRAMSKAEEVTAPSMFQAGQGDDAFIDEVMAEFGQSNPPDRQVAATIWAQLEPGVKMRLGAHTPIYNWRTRRDLSFQIKKGRKPHVYGFAITLVDDLYDVIYWHVNMGSDEFGVQTLGQAHGVDAENLSETVLRLFEQDGDDGAHQHQDGESCMVIPPSVRQFFTPDGIEAVL